MEVYNQNHINRVEVYNQNHIYRHVTKVTCQSHMDWSNGHRQIETDCEIYLPLFNLLETGISVGDMTIEYILYLQYVTAVIKINICSLRKIFFKR